MLKMLTSESWPPPELQTRSGRRCATAQRSASETPAGYPRSCWRRVYNQDPNVILLLVKAGADINSRSQSGETALIYAAEHNPNPDMIQALLGAGANLEDRDRLGRTALIAAAWGNSNPAVLSALFKAVADMKARSKLGKTVLDYALDNPLLAGSEALRPLGGAMK